MAIPFYTGEEEENNNNNSGQSENNNNTGHFNQVVEEEDECVNNSSEIEATASLSVGMSFLSGLVRELLGVYERYCSYQGSGGLLGYQDDIQAQDARNNNRRTRATTNGRVRSTQTSSPRPDPIPQMPLPDLLQSCCCHIQAHQQHQLPPTIDESNNNAQQMRITRRRGSVPSTVTTNNNRQRTMSQQRRHVPTTTEMRPPSLLDDVDTDPSGLSLDIKMGIDFAYRRIGRDLRMIADEFEEEHSQISNQQRRRRHPAGRNTSSEATLLPLITSSVTASFKVTFALKVVIPATFVGVTLAAFLQKHK